MDEFEQRKKDVLQPLFFEAGAALFDCQSFEYAVAYILYLFSRLGVNGLNTDRAISIMDGEEKKTAGQIIGMLKKYLTVREDVEENLKDALQARNQIVHRFLIENVDRFAAPMEHNKLVREIRTLRSQVRKSYEQLDPLVKAIAAALGDGEINELIATAKAKFMSDTRSL